MHVKVRLLLVLMVCGVAMSQTYDYCTPSKTACWPSAALITTFKANITGEVLVPTDPDYNTVQSVAMKNTRFISRPAFVVFVASEADIVECLKFAKAHGIRVTILSSGHTYIGRSNADDSLQINLSKMAQVTVNLTDSDSSTGFSTTVQSGSTWDHTYQKVEAQGKVIVGGSARTVSAGGYTQGGGHSPMTPKLGLAVDNVIDMIVVTLDGQIRRVHQRGQDILDEDLNVLSSNTDDDLFWALRGGGGGTFGVVTKYRYVIHDPPTGFFKVLALYPFKTTYAGNVGLNVLNFYSSFFKTASRNWGGYIIINSNASQEEKDSGITGNLVISLLHFGPQSDATDDIEHLKNFNSGYGLRYQFTVTNHSTFYDYEKTINDPTHFGTYIWNTLLQDGDLTSHSFGDAMSDIIDPNYKFACTVTLLGGRMRDFDLPSSSVGPGFRSGRGSLSCGIWTPITSPGEEDAIDHAQCLAQAVEKIGNGMYFNEPDSLVVDWKDRFWGQHYDRLLSIKLKYDPTNFFYCSLCVGSDFDVTTNTTLPSSTREPVTCDLSSGSRITSSRLSAFLVAAVAFVMFWGV